MDNEKTIICTKYFCDSFFFKTIDSSDEADTSSATLNSSVEKIDLSQRASVTSLEDLNTFPTENNSVNIKRVHGTNSSGETRIDSIGKTKKKFDSEKACTEEIENIIKRNEGDTG